MTRTPETFSKPNIELTKISIPTFNGDTLNWVTFREQFEIAIHLNKKVHVVQKLVYLQNAVEAGTAKYIIKGLSNSAGSYEQTVECLQQLYDKPMFIHQSHLRAVMEAPLIKAGSTNEMRLFHDIVNQHLSSERTMK